MQTTTINSYAYQQYADDDSIQAFVQAYNQATQYYLTWFATIELPVYTGLSGPLLDWVAEGVYGLTRTSLASPATQSFGAFGTELYGVPVFGNYAPSTQTVYGVPDDLFQRILTWDFYKGDGKRFSMHWLKRRIARFLYGANGTDPQPYFAGFVVGAESTNGISVSVSSHVLTVTLYESTLSQYGVLTPGILQYFQAAFTDGALELPLQYTYACNIVAPLVASVTPNVWNVSGTSASLTTGNSVVTTIAGSGAFTFTWAWTNAAYITVNSPTSSATSFSLAGGVAGNTYAAIATCTVTDLVTAQTAQCVVNLSFTVNAVPPTPELFVSTGGVAQGPLLYSTGGVAEGPLYIADNNS